MSSNAGSMAFATRLVIVATPRLQNVAVRGSVRDRARPCGPGLYGGDEEPAPVATHNGESGALAAASRLTGVAADACRRAGVLGHARHPPR